MSTLSVTYSTFLAGTTAVGSQVAQNFTDIVNYVNNRNSGSATWDTVQSTSASTVPLICSNSTGTQAIAQFQDNGSTVVSVLDGGYLAIGTATAGAKVTVVAGATAGYIANVNSGGGAYLVQRTSDTGSNWRAAIFEDGIYAGTGNGTADVSLFRNAASKWQMTGSLGIGAAPATLLHLTSASDFSITLENTGTDGEKWLIKNIAGINELGGLAFIDSTDSAERVRIDNVGNLGLNTHDFGGGAGCLGILNVSIAPSLTPSGGGVLYVQSGALKYKGSSGTVTTVANA